jgi:hypothetical protein
MAQLLAALGFISIIIWGASELVNINLFMEIFRLFF